MSQSVTEVLRDILIDIALDNRDFDRLRLLTSKHWEKYVVEHGDADPFEFLLADEHFFECRVIDISGRDTILNYRYKELQNEILFIGEIRVPVAGNGSVQWTYRPMRKTVACEASEPAWLKSLVHKARQTSIRLHGASEIR